MYPGPSAWPLRGVQGYRTVHPTRRRVGLSGKPTPGTEAWSIYVEALSAGGRPDLYPGDQGFRTGDQIYAATPPAVVPTGSLLNVPRPAVTMAVQPTGHGYYTAPPGYVPTGPTYTPPPTYATPYAAPPVRVPAGQVQATVAYSPVPIIYAAPAAPGYAAPTPYVQPITYTLPVTDLQPLPVPTPARATPTPIPAPLLATPFPSAADALRSTPAVTAPAVSLVPVPQATAPVAAGPLAQDLWPSVGVTTAAPVGIMTQAQFDMFLAADAARQADIQAAISNMQSSVTRSLYAPGSVYAPQADQTSYSYDPSMVPVDPGAAYGDMGMTDAPALPPGVMVDNNGNLFDAAGNPLIDAQGNAIVYSVAGAPTAAAPAYHWFLWLAIAGLAGGGLYWYSKHHKRRRAFVSLAPAPQPQHNARRRRR